jgi:multicomponent Na+:H+ antiporter subunit G
MIELIGLILVIIGAFGLLRMPDVYNKIHASGLISYGLFIIILSIGFGKSFLLFSKSLIIVIFLFIASPPITSMIAHAAYKNKVKPYTGGKK